MVAPWMMPIFCTAGTAGPNTYSGNIRVPIDNESLMFFRLRWSYEQLPANHVKEYRDGEWFYPQLIPGTWRPRDNVNNSYNIDRDTQRSETYTGIRTFPLQDIAMIEDQWGPIAKRTLEHLTSMDKQIIYVRNRLIKTAKDLANGVEPQEPWHPEAYRYHVEFASSESLPEAIEQAKAKSTSTHVTVEAPGISAEVG